jgi:hypothetical protein
MAIKNGTLQVPSFDPTGNPGEYTITGAVLNSLTCPNGAYDIQLDWVIWSSATDPNTGMQIPGVAHRYKVTQVVVSTDNGNICDLTILWDEVGPEQDAPTNGSVAVISERSPLHHFGYVVSNELYPEVFVGAQTAILNEEIQNITDNISGGGSGGSTKFVKTFILSDWQTAGEILLLDISHNLGTTDYIVKVYEEVSPSEFQETLVDNKPLNSLAIRLLVAESAAFQGKVVIV